MSRSPDTRVFVCFALAGIIFGLSGDARAHVDGSPAGGFAGGVTHPLLGLDHVLAMISVGLWGAQLGAPAVWVLPVAFPMVMALGGMLGLIGYGVPGVEAGIAVSAIALGIAVSSEARPPLGLAVLLVGFFAVFHGHAHGTELPEGANGLYYSAGFVIATGSLHAAGIAAGLTHRWHVGRMALRLGGVFVALAGIYFLVDIWA